MAHQHPQKKKKLCIKSIRQTIFDLWIQLYIYLYYKQIILIDYMVKGDIYLLVIYINL